MFSLIAGMACCFAVLLFVQHELSYDQYHEHAERVYRVSGDWKLTNRIIRSASVGASVGPLMKQSFTGVAEYARLMPAAERAVVQRKNRRFYEDQFFFADPSIFDIFTIPFAQGDATSALKKPFSIVLTQQAARKYFGNENPIGQTLIYQGEHVFHVEGVLEEMSTKTHLTFEFLAPLSTVEQIDESVDLESRGTAVHTYLLLNEGYESKGLQKQLSDFASRHSVGPRGGDYELKLQSVADIYLHSNRRGDFKAGGNLEYLRILVATALFILLVAGANYTNLAVARSMQRAKEVGVRKGLGAHRNQLFRQYVGEALILSFGAFSLSIGCVKLVLPAFSELLGTPVELRFIRDWILLMGFGGVAAIVGFVAGSYPALYLSSMQPSSALNKRQTSGPGGEVFWKLLVVFQFTIAVFFIVATLVMREQISYVQSRNLFFEEERVVTIPLKYTPLEGGRYQPFKAELLGNPRIIGATASSMTPTRGSLNFIVTGTPGNQDAKEMQLKYLSVDHDFLSTLGIDVISGRNFSEELLTDESKVILNETAARQLNVRVGEKVQHGPYMKEIVGIVNDFHYSSLREEVEPVALTVDPSDYEYVTVKIAAGNIQATLRHIEKVWNQLAPDHPFVSFFLETDLDRLYHAEERVKTVFEILAALVLLISCIGLLGLTAYAIRRRMKEIGIRKVFGASVADIVFLLSKDFTVLVVAGIAISTPIVYVAMNNWLKNFAYRIYIGVDTLLLAGLLTLIVAWATVAYNTVSAALSEPASTLRKE